MVRVAGVMIPLRALENPVNKKPDVALAVTVTPWPLLYQPLAGTPPPSGGGGQSLIEITSKASGFAD
jgi:hypothetical protein